MTNIGNLVDNSPVINSAEVEQKTEQGNVCETSLCVNAIGEQTQTAAAAVTNIGNLVDDSPVINSAEVDRRQNNRTATNVQTQNVIMLLASKHRQPLPQLLI